MEEVFPGACLLAESMPWWAVVLVMLVPIPVELFLYCVSQDEALSPFLRGFATVAMIVLAPLAYATWVEILRCLLMVALLSLLLCPLLALFEPVLPRMGTLLSRFWGVLREIFPSAANRPSPWRRPDLVRRDPGGTEPAPPRWRWWGRGG